MSELDKLELYLSKSKTHYERIDEEEFFFSRHQIIAYDESGKRLWDAICHIGSYGYEDGLLEISGNIVDEDKDGDSVVGWLTADDVIRRVRRIRKRGRKAK